MILFVNKIKIKWEWDDHIKSTMKKYESQFLVNKMSNDKIKKK
jgi:hypothetical protein